MYSDGNSYSAKKKPNDAIETKFYSVNMYAKQDNTKPTTRNMV